MGDPKDGTKGISLLILFSLVKVVEGELRGTDGVMLVDS